VFYKITNTGTGAVPGVCSGITVKYTGTLLSGSQFDQNTTGFSAVLGQLIVGWQKGLPIIKAGGSITLYIPPSLGYGSQDIRNNSGTVVIPANSNLKFTIELTAVQ
jgi:FKBP-type peptidyl-prolyl cis-trans isomerase FkpA